MVLRTEFARSLGAVIKSPNSVLSMPLRFAVVDVYNIGGIGVVLYGEVLTGVLKVGANLTFAPKGATAVCGSIETFRESLPEWLPGKLVGVNAKGLKKGKVKKGYLVSETGNDPVKEAESFIAYMIVLNSYTKIITPQCSITLEVHPHKVKCKVDEIIEKNDKWSGKIIETEPKELVAGDAAKVKITPLKPLWVESFSKYPQLSRFIITEQTIVVAVGIIVEVTKIKSDILS